ncbi:tripartite tricarboxylate transporter TctB family protein [Marinomonas ostreistagni]|uniref:tripartite tricarboxylate transporter TctB family protein n=1 Tax=Marinomonas ostreistagni TaxID=359209 RepID=UPI001951CAD1|nr:tripartite tricarboxylate transporter TctB family protein [Marinomonas ostreistagni]MBM6549789.1 tripartite tricarboxylate transporter TctB family protein [Marinomonas ostreistagni]
MFDRLFAGALLGLSGLLAWTAYHFEVPFQYEPLGPKAFPLILSAILALCSVWLLLKPSENKWAPTAAVLVKLLSGVALMTGYAFLFEKAGFIISTAIVGTVFCILFGESTKRAVIYSVALSVVSYFLMKHLLQLNVPTGMLFGG